jgi:alpha-methylacyl-CoA racemase
MPRGPLHGVRVVEMAGLGPGPFAGMVLADMGAEVIRVDRAPTRARSSNMVDLLARGRRSIALDLKQEQGRRVALELIGTADALLEGFRPGVMERLGLGPDVCTELNPRLIYGRMTGWGQDGPYAMDPGHDINYIALAGALECLGRANDRPVPPLNLVGDFGGGGMLLAFGVTAALVERATSGRGQVIDAAMVDGTALLMTMHWGMHHSGSIGERGTNLLDSGAPFYEVYECADGRYVSVGAIEPEFYERLCDLLGLDQAAWTDQRDRSRWPQRKEALVALFRLKTRDEWCAILEHQDTCFAPVLSIDDAAAHPHNVARETFVMAHGLVQPAPAPRLSRTPGAIGRPSPDAGADSVAILRELGHDQSVIQELLDIGAVAQSQQE